jgi:signal transduction histidine kinase
VPNETTGSLVTVQFAGKGPFLVEGDRTRLWIAIKNGLNNAVEATERVDPPEIRSPVVVNWNKTDVDYWVSILDEGIGLRSNVERIFDIGTTTKKDHFGMGLPMARQALMSMGGDIHLTPRDKVGVKFELRWPRLRREAV